MELAGHVCLNCLTGFRGEDLNNFPIGSYVKTMSADGNHFEPRLGSLNTILEVDPLRTIDEMFVIAMSRHSFNIEPYGI
jgi:hypothetical protein